MADFKEILHSNNLKATPQRLMILNEIYKYGHIDFDSLTNNIRSILKSVSVATIYRNINEMLEKSIIKEIKIPNQKHRYEITKQEHMHLYCTKCNHLIDTFIDIKNLESNIANEYSCKVLGSSMVINIICKDCMEK